MQIAGIQKSSMVDYPGRISIVVFTPYCNYDCFYCHNRSILGDTQLMDNEEIFGFLKKRAGIIDAVVVSGGEPTLQKGLGDFVKRCRDLGYIIKLDTNGSNPDIVQSLIDDDLLDFIAIDLKCPFDRYMEICRNNDGASVKKTIELVTKSSMDYEIRTTMVPQITKEEMLMTLQELPRLKRYAIQQYKAPKIFLKEDTFIVNAKPHSAEYLEQFGEMCRNICDNVIVKV